MAFDEMALGVRDRLAAFPAAARAELLHVLILPDFDRAERIGDFWGSPATKSLGELLIDFEEDRVARARRRREAARERASRGRLTRWTGTTIEDGCAAPS